MATVLTAAGKDLSCAAFWSTVHSCGGLYDDMKQVNGTCNLDLERYSSIMMTRSDWCLQQF